jgi:hypothetical protein
LGFPGGAPFLFLLGEGGGLDFDPVNPLLNDFEGEVSRE